MSKKFIKCGKFFDGLNEVLRTNVNIVVEDDIIREVGEDVVCPEGAEVIDLSGLTVTPGLIDAHIHLDTLHHWLFDSSYLISDEMKTLNIVHNAEMALQGGFTTLRYIGSGLRTYGAIDARNAINDGVFPASRLIVSPHGMGISGGHSDSSSSIAGNFYLSEELEKQLNFMGNGVDFYKTYVRKEVKYGADFIKIMASGGFASPNDDPCDCQLDDDELRAIIDTAHRLNKTVTAHVYSAEIAKNLIKMGIDGIEHGSLIDEETCQMMLDNDVYLCCTFQPYQEAVHMDEEKLATKSPHFQRKLHKYVDQLRATRKLVVDKILEGKMTIGYGTDMVSVYECWECWREFHTWREEGIPALRTLRAATSVNAKILGLADQIGSIEPGKKADISAWHRDIENDIEAISECDFVMKEGVVYKNCCK